MNLLYAMLALDLANERSREADQMRLARLVRESQADDAVGYEWLPSPDLTASLRRRVARATAAISLRAAAATRRLDDNVAEDLGRTIALAD